MRADQVPAAIAQQLGLPTSPAEPLSTGAMVVLGLDEAAHVLAVAGATSLAYDSHSPPAGALRDARAALDDLAADATFLSNGHWRVGGPSAWNALTCATFDCGGDRVRPAERLHLLGRGR